VKPWLLLPLSVCAAVPVRLIVSGGLLEDSTPMTSDPTETVVAASTVEELAGDAARLRDETEQLEGRLAQIERTRPRTSPARTYDEDEIGAAVERWLAANELDPKRRTEAPTTAATSAASDLTMVQLLEFFDDRQGFGLEAQLMYGEVRAAGRMDELVAAMEARVEADPNDPEAQAALGITYLQKLFGLGATPEAGQTAVSADQAFSRALDLDPRNTGARFMKAIALSNWPSFMGKTGEALEHFEILRKQVEEPGRPDEGFERLYLYLGNTYQRIEEHEKATEAWRAGLDFYPGNAELAEQLELMGTEDS
jgi:tetratricopeptide (TPR) repeat protein